MDWWNNGPNRGHVLNYFGNGPNSKVIVKENSSFQQELGIGYCWNLLLSIRDPWQGD